jgi:hypothetical protein
VFDIGKRNHLALRKILWKAGVLLSGEAVGGTTSRTVRLEIDGGRLWLQEACGQRELVAGFPRAGAQPSRAPAPVPIAAATPYIKKGEGNGLPGLNRR